MKSLMLTSFMLLSSVAFAQTAETTADLTCRHKAKEIALQTYSLCMSDSKSQQTDALRRAYEEEALKLKAQYEAEIAKLQTVDASAATGSATDDLNSPKIKTPELTLPLLDKKQKTEIPANKGVSKVLPPKKTKTASLPIQTVIEGPKVVNISGTLSPDLDNE